MKSQMTPRERMTAFAKGAPIDRVPAVPDMGVTMAPLMGISAKDYYHSAEKMAAVEIELFKELNHDSVSISTSLRGVAEAMGAEVAYPDYQVSYLLKPIIQKPEEVATLKVADPLKDGKLPLLLEAIERTYTALHQSVDVSAAMSGPISVAASVLGTETLLRWMIREPKALHEVMAVVLESNNRYIDEVAKRGVGIGIADPVSSMSLLSPSQFRTFSLPYLKAMCRHIEQKTGSAPGLHICGKSRAIWEDVVDAGISNFSLDNVESLSEAKAAIGDRVIITGNVPPVEVMHLGTKAQIAESVQACIEAGKDAPKGYILSTGCQIPMHTPIENLHYFMEAADLYGRY
ncbi:uroporphyrinogen decarboxylase family protein [Fusibacter sp. JL298sf-3]